MERNESEKDAAPINESQPESPALTDTASKSGHRHMPFIARGTPSFTRVTAALFSAGLATFALLYCVQPILPILSADFNISPASSSLSLSLSTAMLAVGLLFTGPISDAVGRKPVMVTALLLAALFTIASTLTTSWHGILITRALVGLALSGVAAVAMSYLSEEIDPMHVAFAMGLYISGNSIGGMSGRLLTGVLTDIFSWRITLGIIGLIALVAALVFWRILPPSRHFRPLSLRPRTLLLNFRLHWHDRGLPLLFAEGFLLMGSFVTLFNYIGYRLMEAPYNISQTFVGFLSLVYLTGTYSSPKAGALTFKFGRGRVFMISVGLMLLGLCISLFSSIWLILVGLLIFSCGFFAAHSVASSWIGQRAKRAKGQASALYLFFYYTGSSIAGTSGGLVWYHYGWSGLVLFLSLMLICALFISRWLSLLPSVGKKKAA